MKLENKLIEKYNIPVPRYTSYPPANHFKTNFAEKDFLCMIDDSNKEGSNHISIYIHIPFCSKICFYCGCNACTIRNEKEVTEYFEALEKELNNVFSLLNKERKVSQIHYGGGTPNAVDVRYIEKINAIIFNEFDFIDDAEIAIECNPAYLDFSYIDSLLNAGFNRFSLGIQDFDKSILKTVNRDPSKIDVPDILQYIKSKKKEVSVNLDFIYGLPGQSKESFTQTIEKAIEMKPDRLVTFSYAHVPWMKKHQQVLEKKGLPSSNDKMEMFLSARGLLKNAGYVPIGLDHYVLPADELNLALKDKNLHRNFQGYCTKRTTGQVYAFGLSAISQLNKGYAQNFKDVKDYTHALNNDVFPVEKGLVINNEQILIADVIKRLMCNKFLNIKAVCKEYNINMSTFESITHFNPGKLKEFIDDGLLLYDNDEINITEKGSLFIRNIAATMDPEYTQQKNRYSKTV